MNKRFFALLVLSILFSIGGVWAAVSGASVNLVAGTDTSAAPGSAGTNNALAGNVTELTIDGLVNTQAWQGYYGNVTGVIQLANSNSDVMYNWSLANPQGELYASTDNSVTWASIDCFNYTADGATQETAFGITEGDVDGINETFSLTDHNGFYVGAVDFSAGNNCSSTRIFDSTQAGVDQNFEEVLLWDGDAMVFAALLEQDTLGFDNNPHDFQIMVLENGHSGNTATTPYYFYVELE